MICLFVLSLYRENKEHIVSTTTFFFALTLWLTVVIYSPVIKWDTGKPVITTECRGILKNLITSQVVESTSFFDIKLDIIV